MKLDDFLRQIQPDSTKYQYTGDHPSKTTFPLTIQNYMLEQISEHMKNKSYVRAGTMANMLLTLSATQTLSEAVVAEAVKVSRSLMEMGFHEPALTETTLSKLIGDISTFTPLNEIATVSHSELAAWRNDLLGVSLAAPWKEEILTKLGEKRDTKVWSVPKSALPAFQEVLRKSSEDEKTLLLQLLKGGKIDEISERTQLSLNTIRAVQSMAENEQTVVVDAMVRTSWWETIKKIMGVAVFVMQIVCSILAVGSVAWVGFTTMAGWAAVFAGVYWVMTKALPWIEKNTKIQSLYSVFSNVLGVANGTVLLFTLIYSGSGGLTVTNVCTSFQNAKERLMGFLGSIWQWIEDLFKAIKPYIQAAATFLVGYVPGSFGQWYQKAGNGFSNLREAWDNYIHSGNGISNVPIDPDVIEAGFTDMFWIEKMTASLDLANWLEFQNKFPEVPEKFKEQFEKLKAFTTKQWSSTTKR
jgi:hypothetical protein